MKNLTLDFGKNAGQKGRERKRYIVEYRNQEKIDLVSRAVVRTGATGACRPYCGSRIMFRIAL